ncbi:RNA-binding protein Musashi-like protein 1 [Cucumis melo var. makuwa]|uniref:RNA-binding protein Musashi-like protein 1 n=1 Tax=Cucumis melo var. makuwa TaxID=1194695 RepID=A0A5D3BI28_CUCMM|nr:RNA-binding protein Musashi-like protein 1 [Cucumis melo var. makuwa]
MMNLVRLLWYLAIVCEKEVCLFLLSCAGSECERFGERFNFSALPAPIHHGSEAGGSWYSMGRRYRRAERIHEQIWGVGGLYCYEGLPFAILIVERSTGRSRGFGYVTFATDEDAKNALSSEHFLGNRMMEVKVATPKEEMRAPPKRVTRIFVARISQTVTEAAFRSHFEKYGEITDLYMPKDQGSKTHRGIGFITFASSDSVENLMADTHELGGSTVVVDRATPKDDDFRPIGKMPQGGGGGGYGAYNAYISAATRYAALGAPTLYDHPGSVYGRREFRGMGKKIFVGRLPQEASADDLRQYFGRFGRILDVYVPKDPKRSGHRGFGFVTFAEDGVADRVSRRSHEICGQQVAIDSATPLDDAGAGAGASGASGTFMMNSAADSFGGYVGPMRTYGRMYGSLDFDDISSLFLIQWGYGIGGGRPSRADWRSGFGG